MNPFALINGFGPWKWAVYGAIALAALTLFLSWRSSLINEGRQRERAEWAETANVESAEALKSKLEAIAEKEAELLEEANEVSAMRESVTAEREALEAERAEIARTHRRTLEEFNRRLRAIAPDVAAVPEERLDAEIAAALAEHRRLDGAQ